MTLKTAGAMWSPDRSGAATHIAFVIIAIAVRIFAGAVTLGARELRRKRISLRCLPSIPEPRIVLIPRPSPPGDQLVCQLNVSRMMTVERLVRASARACETRLAVFREGDRIDQEKWRAHGLAIANDFISIFIINEPIHSQISCCQRCHHGALK
jgi:hypothetical protein